MNEFLSSNLSGWYILADILYFVVTSFRFFVHMDHHSFGNSGVKGGGGGKAGEDEGGGGFF